MKRPKAVPAAAPGRARDRRRADLLGGKIDPEAIPDIIAMQPCTSARRASVSSIPAVARGVEGLDADTRSLGIYPDQKQAADAVTRAAGGQR